MTIGGSIFLIALGAILRFAVNTSVAAVSLATVGNILMVAGLVGLVVGLYLLTVHRGDAVVAAPEDRVVVDRRIR